MTTLTWSATEGGDLFGCNPRPISPPGSPIRPHRFPRSLNLGRVIRIIQRTAYRFYRVARTRLTVPIDSVGTGGGSGSSGDSAPWLPVAQRRVRINRHRNHHPACFTPPNPRANAGTHLRASRWRAASAGTGITDVDLRNRGGYFHDSVQRQYTGTQNICDRIQQRTVLYREPDN